MEITTTVSNFLLEEHPTHAAATLAQQPAESVGSLLDELPSNQTVTLLRAMAPTTAADCLHHMTKVGPVIETMTPDDASRILRAAPRQVVDDLLADVKAPHARAIRAKMSFDDATIGALVERALLLSPDTTLDEAKEKMKAVGAPYVYAVDKNSHVLGVAKSATLWQEPPTRTVGSIMHRGVVCLDHRTPVQSALRHPAWKDYDMMPVVDGRNECIGILRHKVLRQHTLPETARPPIQTALETVLDLAELYWTSSSALVLGPSMGSSKDNFYE